MNAFLGVGIVIVALLAGLAITIAPLLGVILALLAALAISLMTARRQIELATITVVVTLIGLFAGLLNPAIVSTEILGFASTFKWAALILPIIGALGFSPRARDLMLRPRHWCARFFLLFIVWSGVVLIMRAGLDAELLFKWGSVLLVYLFAFGVVPGMVAQGADGGRSLLRAFGLVAGLIAVASLVLFIVATPDALSMGRLTGVAFNALTLAMFLTLGAITFITLGLTSKTVAPAVVYFIMAALCGGLLLVTGGRASAIALVVGLATLGYGLLKERRARFAIAIPASLGAAAMLLVIATQVFGIRLDQGLLREKGGEGTRLALIQDAASLLAGDPLTLAAGAGFGVVRKTYYARLGIGNETDLTATYRDAFPKLLHNSYLEILVETGVVGLALILCCMIIGFRHLHAVTRRLPPGARTVGYGCLAIGVAAAIESAFNSVLLAPGGALSIWLWSIMGVYSSASVPVPTMEVRAEHHAFVGAVAR
jgi:hypothetical protein